MKPTVLYRVAAVLLVLFAIAHTLGFTQSDPSWGADAMLASMRSIHFDILGSNRSYWDFFEGSGYTVGVLYLFSAVLALQLSRLASESLALMGLARWAFAACYAAIAVVSVMHLFIIPITFSIVITITLAVAASATPRTA